MVVPFFILFYRGPRQRIPRDARGPRRQLLASSFFTPVSVLRPGKAKAMESPGKFVASLLLFRARFCWSRPAASRSSRIWPDRVAVYFLRPRTPRPPSPSDRAAVREEFSDKSWHRVTNKEPYGHRSAFKATEPLDGGFDGPRRH